MKAFVRTSKDNQELVLSEVPLPEIGSDEVLIKVGAFGVGIHDRYFIPMDAVFPYVIGSEGAGTIVAVGDEVTDFGKNERVIFTTILQSQGGSWAEYAVAKREALIPLPDNISLSEGAAIPIAGKTALECMRTLDVKKGEKLFIAGASGAIGTFVIQLAVQRGILVSASASQKNHAYMESLGAIKTVDYNDSDWKNIIREWSPGGVDAVLAIQPGTGVDSIGVVKDGGRLITVSGDNDSVTPERNITVEQMGHHSDMHTKVLELVESISKGDIRVEVEKEYPLSEALEALNKTETRHARGKCVVTL